LENPDTGGVNLAQDREKFRTFGKKLKFQVL
jgi:hypothetical protein